VSTNTTNAIRPISVPLSFAFESCTT
jgi:hypothetical protein